MAKTVPTPQVNPALQIDMQKLVIAGKKVMYAPQTASLLRQGLTSGAAPSDILASQIAGILKIVDDKSGMNVPKQAMIPAGIALMLDLTRFVEQTGAFKFTLADVKAAIIKMVLLLVREYSIYDQQVAQGREALAQRTMRAQQAQQAQQAMMAQQAAAQGGAQGAPPGMPQAMPGRAGPQMAMPQMQPRPMPPQGILAQAGGR